MYKKIALLTLLIALSLGISIALDSFIRNQIFELYKLCSGNRIIFVGKNFHLFPSNIYIISFTISISILFFCLINYKLNVLKNIILWLTIFIVSMILICYIDANRLIIECTACKDGIQKLGYNDIKHDLIICICSFLSLIPLFLFKKKKG